MASLRELKKRLGSINTVGQLAGAMRTVSAAKFSRVSNIRSGFLPYARSCDAMLRRFGAAVAEAIPCGNPEAPGCCVVMAGNRGLCGGYNVEILSYAAEYLRSLPADCRIVAVGARAETSLREGGFSVERTFILPDVPEFAACGELFSWLREAYTAGEISSVSLIYHEFVNMLTRKPTVRQILPMEDCGSGATDTEALLLPDRETVLKTAAVSCVDSVLYSAVLSAAAGAQAATLVAMRSAYDNAQESIANLETEISRKRQSEVTNSVLETASGNTQ